MVWGICQNQGYGMLRQKFEHIQSIIVKQDGSTLISINLLTKSTFYVIKFFFPIHTYF